MGVIAVLGIVSGVGLALAGLAHLVLGRLSVVTMCSPGTSGTSRLAPWAVLGVISSALLVLAGLPVVALAVAGFCFSWSHLRRIAAGQRRREGIRRSLPVFLGVLETSMRAGAALEPALLAVARAMPGDLSDEIERTVAEITHGVPRETALEALARRARCAELDRFVVSVRRSSHFGTPLAETLAATAEQARRTFRQETRRRAARAQARVSLVVTLLVVPGILLPITAALFVAFVPDVHGLLGGRA